jgi:hypothetical protein
MQVELLDCPLCGVAMNRTSVGAWHPHPSLDRDFCVLSGFSLAEDHFALWNTRTPSPATGSAVPASTVTAEDIQHLKMIEQGIEDGGWHIAALHLTAIRQTLEATVAPSPVGEGQPVAWQVREFSSEENCWGMWQPCRQDELEFFTQQHFAKRFEVRPLYLAAQAPKPASGGGEPRLTASAKVGNTTFAAGVKERLVIECAQRAYAFMVQQNREREAIAAEAGTANDDPPRCPKCGYTNEDCRTHMDHHLCGLPDPPAADRLAQTVTDAIRYVQDGDAPIIEYAKQVAADIDQHEKDDRRLVAQATLNHWRMLLRRGIEAAIRARESAPAQEALREAIMRVMRVERDHAVEVFRAADGQSSPKTRDEFKAAWDALNELLSLAAAPRAGG